MPIAGNIFVFTGTGVLSGDCEELLLEVRWRVLRTIGRTAVPVDNCYDCIVAYMTPGEFIAKWRASTLKERSAAQEHFIDLCRLLGEPTPAEADPTGEHYCFERGARKDTGGDGWGDVWKRHCFAWEYKGKHADLDAAFNQLRQYALALETPRLSGRRAEELAHWPPAASSGRAVLGPGDPCRGAGDPLPDFISANPRPADSARPILLKCIKSE